MWPLVVAIAVGASSGALLRWFLGLQLNAWLPAIPLGTLAANLLGGYLVGVAIALFPLFPSIAPEWRLLFVTGFCGGLTTFSTFSAEVIHLLQQGRWGMAATAAALHLVGSVAATFLGVATVQQVVRSGGA